MSRLHVRRHLPWVRSGPLHKVHADTLPEVEALLARHDHVRVDLDGRTMTSRAATHAQIGRVLDFPDWYGPSWDGFNDCLGPFVVQNDGALVVVVWQHADEAARLAPTSAMELSWALLDWRHGGMPTLGAGTSAHVDVEVFVVGVTDDFERPEPAQNS